MGQDTFATNAAAIAEAPPESPSLALSNGPVMTRDCLDPWNGAFIRSNGDVNPCCYRREVWGNIHSSAVDDIFNGPIAQGLRQELIDGKLTAMCAVCPTRPTATVPALKARVSEFLSSSTEAPESASDGVSASHSTAAHAELADFVPQIPDRENIDELLETLAERERRVCELENSRSWRMTAPLRSVFSWFRRTDASER